MTKPFAYTISYITYSQIAFSHGRSLRSREKRVTCTLKNSQAPNMAECPWGVCKIYHCFIRYKILNICEYNHRLYGVY